MAMPAEPPVKAPRAGRLILVVGPSGAGKDTLIDAAIARRAGLARARRVVTRPEEAGGEDIEAVSPERFELMERAGAFALSWRAHGLGYGIPEEAMAPLADGRDVIANVSRRVVATARMRFPGLRVVVVTASPAVLATRLVARGREDDDAVAARIARAADPAPEGEDVTVVRNDGPLEAALAAFLAALQPESG
jgi:ribose 1,5-bisphosphokinase